MTRITALPADDDSCGWFHLSKPRKTTASHGGNSAARWVVVGAGFTGLAAARQLAFHFPDDQIIVLEAQVVGYGASGRNAGFAIDLPHDITSGDYVGDATTARMVLKLNRAGQQRLRSLVAEHKIDCQFQSIGKYHAAVEPRGLAALEAYRHCLEGLGEPYDFLEEDALPEHLGTSFYRAALFTPGAVLLQPAALVQGLADTLPANVQLFENTPITAVEYGSKTVLSHAKGRITADRLVLANNAFGAQFGLLQHTMVPIFTYASLTRQLTEDEQARLGGKPAWGLIPGDPFGSTLRRTHDNRILVRNSFSFNPNGRSDRRYRERFVRAHRVSFTRRFPMLPEMPFEYTWGGCLAISKNHAGHFGEFAPNVYGALCCNGLGVTRGTITGILLADWLAGERHELIDFLLTTPRPKKIPLPPLLPVAVNIKLWLGQTRAGLEQ